MFQLLIYGSLDVLPIVMLVLNIVTWRTVDSCGM